MRRDRPLLTRTPPLDDSTVDANNAACACCSVREERTHNGGGQPCVQRLDFAVRPDSLDK